MTDSAISIYKNRILQLEAELNYAKSELAQCTQFATEVLYDLKCDDYGQLLFEVGFEGLVVHTNLTVIDVNSAISKILGHERSSLIGRNILDFVPTEYHDLIKTRVQADYANPYEVEAVKQDGAKIPVEIQGKTIQWRGQAVRVTAVRDISDRKKTEATLLDIQKRYETLFNHKSNAVFINSFTEIGKPSQFIEVNDAACQSLGYSRAELLTMNPSHIMPKDFFCDPQIMVDLRTQKYATGEVLHQAKDGRIFPVELSLNQLETSEGKTLIIAFTRDISDRKKAEAALLEGKSRYQALFSAKSEAVFIHGFTKKGNPTNFIEVNEAACLSLGYTKAELLQMSPRNITPKGFRPPINIPQKLAQDKCVFFEAQHQTKDGRIFPVEVRTVLLDTTEKRLVIDFVRNISDRKAVEIELEHIASSDYLTQVANRRQFDQYLESEWKKAWRDQAHLSLIMCDIDCFKLYNDCYGHQMGDKCLQQVASAIANTIKRPSDLMARYGGEEFGIILPATKGDGALNVAENIRQVVKDLQIKHEKSTVIPFVTMSLGVATLIPTSGDFSTLIEAADCALYNAKQSGRDRSFSIQDAYSI